MYGQNETILGDEASYPILQLVRVPQSSVKSIVWLVRDQQRVLTIACAQYAEGAVERQL